MSLWSFGVNTEPKLSFLNLIKPNLSMQLLKSYFSSLVKFEFFGSILNQNCQFWNSVEPNLSKQLSYHWNFIILYIGQLWNFCVNSETNLSTNFSKQLWCNWISVFLSIQRFSHKRIFWYIGHFEVLVSIRNINCHFWNFLSQIWWCSCVITEVSVFCSLFDS